jgi:hypothetical protein
MALDSPQNVVAVLSPGALIRYSIIPRVGTSYLQARYDITRTRTSPFISFPSTPSPYFCTSIRLMRVSILSSFQPIISAFIPCGRQNYFPMQQ